jgi:hypothetical protein
VRKSRLDVLYVRGILALAIVVIGAIVLVRMLALGVRIEILPGVVLGIAMIALGLHRLSLILRVLRNHAS